MISHLKHLDALQISGGIWNKNTVRSLVPLSYLPNLRELGLGNIKVESGGIYPLARCTSIKELSVSNRFTTEEFAYLSVYLNNAKCTKFAPWVRLPQSIGENDIMVVGKGKPFLNSEKDKELMEKYSTDFSRLQKKFLSEKRT
jgi:hypothetical protein